MIGIRARETDNSEHEAPSSTWQSSPPRGSLGIPATVTNTQQPGDARVPSYSPFHGALETSHIKGHRYFSVQALGTQ